MSTNNYLSSSFKQFEYYKYLGERAMEQLQPEQLFFSPNEASNSIAVIVKHLWGNMRSRWTDFLTSDGEKPWRNRDEEFADDISSREELMKKWDEGWMTLFEALNTLDESKLTEIIYIRNQGHSVLEAVNRQLCHYSYHIGQIVYIARLICNSKWKSLSISKGESEQYNAARFEKEKKRVHFTDDIRSEDSSK